MSYKINDTVVVDDSRNVCACCVTSCCFTASDQMIIPSGNTAGRPTGATGSLYFDTDEAALVAYDGTEWATQGGAGMPTCNLAGAPTTYTFAGNLKDLNSYEPIMPYNTALSDAQARCCNARMCMSVIPRATGMLQTLVCSDDAFSCCFSCFNETTYLSPDRSFVSIGGKGGATGGSASYGFSSEDNAWYYSLTCSGVSQSLMSKIGNKIIVAHLCCCHFAIYDPTTGCRCFCGTLSTSHKIKGIYEAASGNLGLVTDYSNRTVFTDISLTDCTTICGRMGGDYLNQTDFNLRHVAQTTDKVAVGYRLNCGVGACCDRAVVLDKTTGCIYHYCPPTICGCSQGNLQTQVLTINDNIYLKTYVEGYQTQCAGTVLTRVCDNFCLCGGVVIQGRCCAWWGPDNEKVWPRFNAETVSFPFHHKCYIQGTYQALATVDLYESGSTSNTFKGSDQTGSPAGYCIYFSKHTTSCPSFCTGVGLNAGNIVCSGVSGGCLAYCIRVHKFICC